MGPQPIINHPITRTDMGGHSNVVCSTLLVQHVHCALWDHGLVKEAHTRLPCSGGASHVHLPWD